MRPAEPGRTRAKNQSASILLLMMLAACQTDPTSQRGVAERFLDAHYVDIDLGRAGELVAGLAEKKLADERRLTAGQSIDETTLKPSVYYRFLEEHPEGTERSRLVYQATFSIPGGPDLERRILLVLRRDGAGWKVVNFDEFE